VQLSTSSSTKLITGVYFCVMLR